MKRLIVFPLVSAAILLSGCDDPAMDVLREMKKIDHATQNYKEPLPSKFAVEHVSYEVSGQRSPFIPFVLFQDIKNPAAKAIYINPNRKPQPLESFTLDALSVVGTVSKGGHLSALIQTPDGDLVIADVGDYMGQDLGRIKHIDKNGISLVEALPDGRGGYVEKQRSKPVSSSLPAPRRPAAPAPQPQLSAQI